MHFHTLRAMKIMLSCWALLLLRIFNAAAADIPNARYAGKFDASPVRLPAAAAAPAREMRGVWVATVNNLDFPQTADAESFRKEARALCRKLAAAKFNALFFQVRTHNDAFYASELNPWSRFLTGREGVAPTGEKGFDPLKFLIAEAHRNGLELHAWLNPYRVTAATKLSKSAYLATLAANNFARRHPELVLETVSGGQRKLVLNPGEPRVREFVTATVMELVRKYDLDGIHFDDYFYPDRAPAAADAAAYRQYNPRRLELADWRRANVNELIFRIHNVLLQHNRSTGRQVRFGISPFGIWRNRKSTPEGSLTGGNESYAVQYADTRLWVKRRWIDYIAPQLYWPFNHDVAAYAALVDWWAETVRGTGVELYIGMAPYRLGTPGWGLNELYYQLRYNRAQPNVAGVILFSYRSLNTPANNTMKRGGREMLESFWKKPAAVR